jgi:hypothetical protein
MKTFNKVFMTVVLIFLYIPMIVLAVASFNSGTDPAVGRASPSRKYGELFRDGVLLPLLRNSAHRRGHLEPAGHRSRHHGRLGIHAMGPRMKRTVMGVTNIP